jgi:hypothetical protein
VPPATVNPYAHLKRPLLERFAFHPLLFAVNPVVLLYSLNLTEAGPGDFLRALGVSLAVTLFIMGVAWLILKSAPKAGAIASLLMFACFLFQVARLSLQESWTDLSIGAVHGILCAVYLLILGCVVYPIWRARAVSGLTRILNVTGSFLLLISLASLAGHWITSPRAPAIPARSRIEPPKQRVRAGDFPYSPDIYFIVLDQYPRSDTLSNILDYDNKPFLDRLRQTGFHVVERSASNYPYTAMSICSTLNLNYLDKTLLGSVNVFTFARERGYRTVYLPPVFGTGTPLDNVVQDDAGGAGGLRLDVDTILTSSAHLSAFSHALLQMTPFEDLLEAFSTPYSIWELHRRHVLFTLDALKKLPRMGRTLKAPLLVYAHIMCPHPPIVFEAGGGRVPPSEHLPTTRPWIKDERFTRNYRGQVAFISKQALEVVEAILSTSQRPPVIVLCSDHGSEFEIDWDHPESSNLPERMANLDALYLPGDAARMLYPTMTNVNIFRVIFDYYFGTDFPLLPDHSYFSKGDTPYQFIRVPMEGPVRPLFTPAPAARN